MHSSQQAVMHNSLVRLASCQIPSVAIAQLTILVKGSDSLSVGDVPTVRSANACQRCYLGTVL